MTTDTEHLRELSEELERVYGALRWLYKHGALSDHARPDWMNRTFNDAFASHRIAQPGTPEPRAQLAGEPKC